jgi:multiple sugar transport system ATP-binding protein
MVFQNYALYPHMSVYDNLAFGLKLRGTSKGEIQRRISYVSEILGIGDLLKRKPKQLSGGQRQRVAVGRAIVREPKVFLMDEPLSNLDAKLRVQTRAELVKLHSRLQTTVIYVTHDQVEAMTMGSRIAVMKDGVLQQLDTPQNLYERPANLFVAEFIGSPAMNFFDAQLVRANSELYFRNESFQLRLPARFNEGLAGRLGLNFIVGIRPEHISEKGNGTAANGVVVKAKIDVVEPLGSEAVVYLKAAKRDLVARTTYRPELRTGRDIEVILNTDRIHVFDPESTKAVA